jgi:hypothetical protein
MSDSVYLLTLTAVTSVVVSVAGVRSGRVRARALRPAAVRLLECVGLSVAFYVLNLAAGFVAVLVLRRVTQEFVSVYVNSDSTLPVLSAFQAIVFQWWRAESGGGEG